MSSICHLATSCPTVHYYLYTAHCILPPSHFLSHCTLLPVHCTAHYYLYTALYTTTCTLHTAHYYLYTAHCTLHTTTCTLHTALLAVHCTLHTATCTHYWTELYCTVHCTGCTVHTPLTLHCIGCTTHYYWHIALYTQPSHWSYSQLTGNFHKMVQVDAIMAGTNDRFPVGWTRLMYTWRYGPLHGPTSSSCQELWHWDDGSFRPLG